MRINIGLKVRTANMVKIELALARLDHLGKRLVEVQPIGAFGAKKLKLVALYLHKRIISSNFLLHGAE